RRTRDLRALARPDLDAVDGRAHRDVADRQGVAGADRRLGAGDPLRADFQATGGDDVAALAVGIHHQGDVGRAVRVVLDALHLAGDPVLVAAEVHHAVVVLVATAPLPGGDVAVVVAAGLLELLLQQGRVGLTLPEVVPRD